MKIVVDRVELLRGIQSVLDIVPTKTALPVLSNILIDSSQPEGIRLNATDLDISITCGVSAKVEKPGSTTIPGKKFGQIIRELPNGKLVLSEKNGKVTVQRLIGEKGMAGNYALMSVPAEEFPELPQDVQGPELKFPNSPESEDNLLCDMISKTVFAVSKDETRPVLNGVLWEMVGGRMTMVATDGHRLAKFSRLVSGISGVEKNTKAIVPPRVLTHLVKLISAGNCLQKVRFGQNHLVFELFFNESSNGDLNGAEKIRLTSRLIEGPYVDYEQVIPQDSRKKMRVSNNELFPAVKRVSVLASTHTHQLRLKLVENQLELSATSQEIGGEAQEILEIEYGFEEITIGYNSGYLQDVLRRIESDQVLFEFESAITAGIIRPGQQNDGEDYFCLLMPLRLNE